LTLFVTIARESGLKRVMLASTGMWTVSTQDY
jgi:hypothetical protein